MRVVVVHEVKQSRSVGHAMVLVMVGVLGHSGTAGGIYTVDLVLLSSGSKCSG